MKNSLDLPDIDYQYGGRCIRLVPHDFDEREDPLMTRLRLFLAVSASAFLVWTLIAVGAAMAQEQPRYRRRDRPGLPPAERLDLETGRTATLPLADLPLNIIPLADNRHALAATSGYNAHELVAHRSARRKSRRPPGRPSRAGSAWPPVPSGDRIWWSGGGGNLAACVSI